MYSSVNTTWVLVGAALVFFMQAGFAMVETGFTRAKNAGNIIMKNLMDFCIGTPVFWLVDLASCSVQETVSSARSAESPQRQTTETQCFRMEFLSGHFSSSRLYSVLLLLPSCPVPWQSVLNSSPTVSTVY